MIVSDATGLFILPFGITMHNATVDLMNALGIFFIPFTVAIVNNFFSARAEGADEGSPSIIFIKQTEKDFVCMLFILLVVVMPANDNSATYSYKQYSHQSTPSLLNGSTEMSELIGNLTFSDELEKGQAPIAIGLINDIGQGISNSLIASIPCTPVSTNSGTGGCTQDASLNKIAEALQSVKSYKGDTRKAISDFHETCYRNALGQYLEYKSLKDDMSLYSGAYPSNSNTKYGFNSSLMQSLYLGLMKIGDETDSSVIYDQLTIDTGDYWPSSVASSDDVYCQVASQAIYDELYSELKELDNYSTYYEPAMNSWVDIYSRYGGDANEMVASSSTVKTEFINAMYINSYNVSNRKIYSLVDGYIFAFNSLMAKYDIEFELPFLPKFINEIFADDAKNPSSSWLEYAGVVAVNAIHLTTSIIGAVDSYTKHEITVRTFPTIIQVSIAATIMFSPFVIVLSGYNPKITYTVLVMLFGTCTSMYIFELGLVIGENILTAASDSSFQVHAIDSVSRSTETTWSFWMRNVIPISMVATWNIFLQKIGGMMYPMLIVSAPEGSNILTDKTTQMVTQKLVQDIHERIKQGPQNSDNLTEEEVNAVQEGQEEGLREAIEEMTPQERENFIRNIHKM